MLNLILNFVLDMDIKGSVHCLFEQSGTFKNEFIGLGFTALDYDIKNDFNQTDIVIDLFREIELCFDDKPSLFDTFTSDDLILAFFPCTYFCQQNVTFFNGSSMNYCNLSLRDKYLSILERSKHREYFYSVILKLFGICDLHCFRLILENPYSPFHFLVNNFPFKPSFIDKNRQCRGDYFVKPTQYFFLNCSPSFGFTRSVPPERRSVYYFSSHDYTAARSMISPVYARNFIKDNILGSSVSSQMLFDL